MKLVACYNVWDGEELLEASIRSVREAVDGVLVCYQTVSHFGEPARDALVPLLAHLMDLGLVDGLLRFVARPPGDAPPGEHYHAEATRKRNLAREAVARDLGATHVLPMDCDEFYRAEELRAARAFVEAHGADTTVCPIQEYRRVPPRRAERLSDYFVPFIADAALPTVRARTVMDFPAYVDPSRCVPGRRPFAFAPGQVTMHHFTGVRASLDGMRRKIENAPTRAWSQADKAKLYEADDCVLAPDVFGVAPAIARWRAEWGGK